MSPKYRYLVFCYCTFYPGGGMHDCQLKTNSKEEARRFVEDNLHEYSYLDIFDTVAGSLIIRERGEIM